VSGIVSPVIDRPLREQVHGFERQARLASLKGERLEVQPEMAGVLADYLRDSLAVAEDQTWFWSEEWQDGEREAEADIAAGRFEVFDSMEDLIEDLGWPQ